MNIVVDASVVASALLDAGDEGSWAENVLRSHACIAPALLPVEVTSVLRRASLAGEISDELASQAHRDWIDLPMDLMPYEPFAPRVWELRHSVRPYDAWYVGIAEAFDIPFATFDQRLSRAPGLRCRWLVPSKRD
ncbi:MAG: type II toxin-antitoxin system VapC family toxin [Planctomycetes bacterium]|nr:type II toxin-antitoxin system VapC family toxin [Planctomycetota bacterium]